MRLCKRIAFMSIGLGVAGIFCLGGLTALEILYRSLSAQDRGQLIDTSLFVYQPYTVSRQPANLELGHQNHLLDNFFSHGECDADGQVTARFNEHGFRSRSFSGLPYKTPDSLRVAIVGGSAAMSWNIGERCTLDSRLATELQRIMPARKVEIYNFANAAWKSFQELTAVQLYGHLVDYDVLVHFSGFNDLNHAATMPINHAYSEFMIHTAFDRYAAWVRGSILSFFQEFRIGSWFRNLFVSRFSLSEGGRVTDELPEFAKQAKPGEVRTRVTYPLDLEKISTRSDFDPYNREVVSNFMRNSAFMADAARSEGAIIIEVLQPTLYLKTPRSDVEVRVLRNGYEPDINFTVQGYLRVAEAMKKRAEGAEDINFIDMSRVFNGTKETIFGDNVHFSAQGYEIVAKNLADSIAEILEER